MDARWWAMEGAWGTASAPTILPAAESMSSGPTIGADATTRTVIAATPGVGVLIMLTLHPIIGGRLTMDGRTIRGRHRFITDGVGAERPGMATTVLTSPHTRCIRWPHFG